MNFLLTVITNVNFAVPMVVCVIAVWRVARLRGFTTENYQDRVLESVSDTLKEQISAQLLGPLLQSNGIPLPRGKTSYDVIERMVEHDPNNVGADIFESGESWNYESLFSTSGRHSFIAILRAFSNSKDQGPTYQ